VQFFNLIYKRTTHQKYSYKRGGIYSSMSSTGSIYIKDSEDWGQISKRISVAIEEKGCCNKSNQDGVNESSNINEGD
jgi:hypothetical protein